MRFPDLLRASYRLCDFFCLPCMNWKVDYGGVITKGLVKDYKLLTGGSVKGEPCG